MSGSVQCIVAKEKKKRIGVVNEGIFTLPTKISLLCLKGRGLAGNGKFEGGGGAERRADRTCSSKGGGVVA